MSTTLADILATALAQRNAPVEPITYDEPYGPPTFTDLVQDEMRELTYELTEGYAKLPRGMTQLELAVRHVLDQHEMDLDVITVMAHIERCKRRI